MGILDWFKNRPAQFDPDSLSSEMTVRAIEKAVALTNPRLKLVRSYQECLAPAVDISIGHIRDLVLALPPPIEVSLAGWSADPALRAFFVSASDISSTVGRSNGLRTLFGKFPALQEACFVLRMVYGEQRVLGMALQGEVLQREVMQTVVGFSQHQARICGPEEPEVRRLLGAQAYEYLVAQALSELGEERSERRELESNRALLRSRLRLLQQQGPGLGSVFGSAPASAGEQLKLEAELLENERQMDALGSSTTLLESELETLREVLEHPQRYLCVEQKRLRLSTMNVVVDETSGELASEVAFSVANVKGPVPLQSAFVLGRFARADLLPESKMNFDAAARYL